MSAAKRRKVMSEINVVPYIDVMLVLLVIFMVAAPLINQGIKIDLPKSDSKPLDIQEDEPILVISVKKDSTYYINVGNEERPVSLEYLGEQAEGQSNAKSKVSIAASGVAVSLLSCCLFLFLGTAE